LLATSPHAHARERGLLLSAAGASLFFSAVGAGLILTSNKKSAIFLKKVRGKYTVKLLAL
jgi:hypothetical protein